MKEIKAYVPQDRVADVIAALKESKVWGGERGDASHNLAVYLVRGMVPSVNRQDRHYSVDLGDEVVNEYKIELICSELEVDELVQIIVTAAHVSSTDGGWITVAQLDRALRINRNPNP
jgi:nitrogen regulatory protein P-II 1